MRGPKLQEHEEDLKSRKGRELTAEAQHEALSVLWEPAGAKAGGSASQHRGEALSQVGDLRRQQGWRLQGAGKGLNEDGWHALGSGKSLQPEWAPGQGK